ncbi:MAG: hypothetical protein HDT10_00910, partial [Helicobacter sp.]|nr:hypothetical protein [Helicobacter sp.]
MQEGARLQFPKSCAGWTLIGIQAWNYEKPRKPCSIYNVYSSIRVITQSGFIAKSSSLIRLFNTLNTQIILDDESFCELDTTNSCTERSEAVIMTPDSYTIPYFNLIDFFLAKGGQWEYEIPFNQANIIVEPEYDFKSLIPDVKFLKEIIEEYCAARKLTKAVSQPTPIIKEKPIPSIYLVAKDRIHNHLAYKLGQALILN